MQVHIMILSLEEAENFLIEKKLKPRRKIVLERVLAGVFQKFYDFWNQRQKLHI
jgi:hypothetical protein